MHLILIPILLLSSWSCMATAQTSLGRGDGLDKSRAITPNNNPKYQLPIGTLNNEIRGTGVLQGRDFNEGLGRFSNDGLQLLIDAENLDDEDYQAALNNSPWYWNNWDQQSAQFLLQGDRNYFNPNFTDEWSMAPKQMSRGRTIRTYSHDWDENSTQYQNRDGELEYPDHWSERQVQQYRLGQAIGNGTMQPTAMDVSPIHLSSFRNLQNVGYLTASSLIGVSVETSDRAFQGLGFTTWDAARLEEDRAFGLFDESIVISWRQEETMLDQRVAETELVSSPQYNGLLNSIADRTLGVTTEDEETTTESLNAAYIVLQNQLIGIPFEDEEDETLLTTIETTEDGDVVEENSLEYLSGILRHGERISQFAGGQETRFNEIMREAELSLAKEEYFLAKKRFDQALRFVPGHPLGTAGLGHANIGAGLYLSAGHVLQSLLSLQPEMIDVMYDPQLLPPRLELVRAGVAIQQRLEEKRDGMAYAFLLAYIGHQIHDEEMLTKGIEALERGGEDKDPFVPLLRRIWLPTETP